MMPTQNAKGIPTSSFWQKVIVAVLPVHNRASQTLTCLSTLLAHDRKDITIQVIVVDDGSTDQTEQKVKSSFPEVIVLKGDGHLLWARAVNLGLNYIESKLDCNYILILNNDTLITHLTVPKLLQTLLDYGQRTVISPVILNAETGLIYGAGLIETGPLKKLTPFYQNRHPNSLPKKPLKCQTVGTRLVLMPRTIIQDVGIFDHKRFPHGFSDLEYFMRAKQRGYSILVDTAVTASTVPNRNYMNFRLLTSTTFEYIKSYGNKKYDTHITLIFNKSFVHRDLLSGLIIFIRTSLTHFTWLCYKIFLPRNILRRRIAAKWDSPQFSAK